MTRSLVSTLFALIAALALAACQSAQPSGGPSIAASPKAQTSSGTSPRADASASPAAKLQVIATYSILGDFVRQVGGDQISLRTLVGPGEDAHTFEPSPADGVALVNAALVFENGRSFDAWLDDLYRSSGSKAQRVVVTNGIQPLEAADEGDHADDRDAPQDEHAHGELDPHVWHDVNNAIHMVGEVRDALAQADPANAATYRANAERYIAELEALDGWIVEQVNTLPEPRRKLVTTHDTFQYFANRYGFEVVGTALGAATTEAAEPSAAAIAALVQKIQEANVPAIFAENVNNPKLIQRLATETGATLGPTLYTDALGKPGSDGETYVKMMRYNVTSIVEALKR